MFDIVHTHDRFLQVSPIQTELTSQRNPRKNITNVVFAQQARLKGIRSF